MIHVDFPVHFVREWLSVSDKADISFHYISSSDISAQRKKKRIWVKIYPFVFRTRWCGGESDANRTGNV